jgi:hypothetical protein
VHISPNVHPSSCKHFGLPQRRSTIVFHFLLCIPVPGQQIEAVIFLAGTQIRKYTNDRCEGFFVRECSFVYSICAKLFFLAPNARMHGYLLQNDQFFICAPVFFYLSHK